MIWHGARHGLDVNFALPAGPETLANYLQWIQFLAAWTVSLMLSFKEKIHALVFTCQKARNITLLLYLSVKGIAVDKKTP